MAFLKKNQVANDQERIITLLPASKYKSVIVIIEKAEQIRHNVLHQAFPAATFSFLTIRSSKEDSSSGHNYTFHKSDKRFRKIKNDRLKSLLRTKFDLLIDLSDRQNLSYFSETINASLKTGCFDRVNNYNFDILVKNSPSMEDIVINIAKQIDKLTLNN